MLPFILMLVVVGMPLMLLELGLGQKLRVGAAGAWKKVHPSLIGVGYGSSVVAIIGKIISIFDLFLKNWCFVSFVVFCDDSASYYEQYIDIFKTSW